MVLALRQSQEKKSGLPDVNVVNMQFLLRI
jgi:hypothetical protein